MAANAAYSLVRKAQAAIADYRHFDDGDLIKYTDRAAFRAVAERLALKYFPRSVESKMFVQVQELYCLFLVLAPVLQRLEFSMKLDWHMGHVLGWFRKYSAGTAHRIHAAIRVVPRQLDHNLLLTNLAALGIRDEQFINLFLDQCRRSYGQATVRGRLMDALVDPIMLLHQRDGFELRVCNHMIRVEKAPFPGSLDLRDNPVQIGKYLISLKHEQTHTKPSSHLEIKLTSEVTTSFRTSVKSIVRGSSNPQHKFHLVRREISEFCEQAKFARSDQDKILELKQWLATKLRKLAGTNPEFKRLPNELVYLWHQRLDYRLHLPHRNFFFDPAAVTEEVYLTFYSPYREEVK